MSDNAEDLQDGELEDTIHELNKLVKALRETIEQLQNQQAELKKERDNLQKQADYLTKKLFGSSNEKGLGQIPGQMSFFDEAEPEQNNQCPSDPREAPSTASVNTLQEMDDAVNNFKTGTVSSAVDLSDFNE